MSKKQKTQAEVIIALKKCGGIISKASEMLGLASSNGLRERIKRTPKLLEALDEIRTDLLDKAEDNIVTAIQAGDKDVSWKYLTKMGKERGYGDTVTINGKVTIEQKPDLSNLSEQELAELEKIVSKTTNSG